ncbi:MAG: hypothetical protein M3O32_12090 [Actinomycetota bacterium]|nr:hypothetical protein [Actinomycetota bacterium]
MPLGRPKMDLSTAESLPVEDGRVVFSCMRSVLDGKDAADLEPDLSAREPAPRPGARMVSSRPAAR